MSQPLGATAAPDGIRFAARSRDADAISLCLFGDSDGGDQERRIAMRRDGDLFSVTVPGITDGQRYGLRAEGPWRPDQGLRFDPAKLLIDPYAVELDQRFQWHPDLATHGTDTAARVPKAVVRVALPTVPHQPPLFRDGGLIYEANVRGLTMLHPDIPAQDRGTIRALAHPAIIDHLVKLRVSAIELMPIVAWIDERHLPPLGLSNAWGYNPVAMMPLDPRLAPGGIADLAFATAALRDAGIGTILDLVFNHSGESDVHGATLSMRGLDPLRYYAHAPDHSLINDTGTGNTLDFSEPIVRQLTLDTLRHFVRHAGVDGFRFDLAPILARSPGFSASAPIFADIAADPLLADRIMIAEPWDIGPGGYALGQFPDNWLEWNDSWRDDVRRYWRGDGSAGALATRLAGSTDIFGDTRTRSVNFLAAHDGFTLADLVSHTERHNHANGEDNRDGHSDNLSWNNGVEGATDDPAITAARQADICALIATLFAARGTIMLAAGDEFGRSQQGNNNAYAQDNGLSWIDWHGRDHDLEDFTAALAALRAAHPALSDPVIRHDLGWLTLDGQPMTAQHWENPTLPGFIMRLPGGPSVTIDRAARRCTIDA